MNLHFKNGKLSVPKGWEQKALSESPFCESKAEDMLEKALKFELPGIKNLRIENGVITFDEGKYTKEQVLFKIKEIKNWKP